MKSVIAKYRELQFSQKVIFMVLILIYLFASLCFIYGDQIATAANSVLFWDSLLHGRGLNAYQDVLDLIGKESNLLYLPCPLNYEPVAYFLLGILNMPAVILFELGKLNFNSIIFFTFVKMQLVFMTVVSSYYVYRIVESLCVDRKDCGKEALSSTYMFLSSAGILLFTITIGQIEIFPTAFSLAGIYYWIKKRDLLFVLCFALAIPFKVFALLFFIPLVLQRIKNLWKIMLYCLGGISFWLFPKILYMHNDAYRISLAESSARLIAAISTNSLFQNFYAHVPFFVVCIALLCLFAYLCTLKEPIWGVYLAFVSYALFFILVPHYPYWVVILTPFIPILSCVDIKKKKINIMLDIIYWVAYMYMTITTYSWLTGYGIVDPMILPRLFGHREVNKTRYDCLNDWLCSVGLDEYKNLVNAIWVGALIALIIINYPKLKDIPELFSGRTRWAMCIRCLAVVPVLCSMVLFYYQVKEDVLLDTTAYASETCGYDIFGREAIGSQKEAFVQELRFGKGGIINSIELNLSNQGKCFAAYGSVFIELVAGDADDVLYSYRVGYNEVTNGKSTKLKIPNIQVEANRNYKLLIYADQFCPYPMYTNITKEKVSDDTLLYCGNSTERSLQFKITGKLM